MENTTACLFAMDITAFVFAATLMFKFLLVLLGIALIVVGIKIWRK